MKTKKDCLTFLRFDGQNWVWIDWLEEAVNRENVDLRPSDSVIKGGWIMVRLFLPMAPFWSKS